jgi:hypothetical protein
VKICHDINYLETPDQALDSAAADEVKIHQFQQSDAYLVEHERE